MLLFGHWKPRDATWPMGWQVALHHHIHTKRQIALAECIAQREHGIRAQRLTAQGDIQISVRFEGFLIGTAPNSGAKNQRFMRRCRSAKHTLHGHYFSRFQSQVQLGHGRSIEYSPRAGNSSPRTAVSCRALTGVATALLSGVKSNMGTFCHCQWGFGARRARCKTCSGGMRSWSL